ncbi:MAG: FAD-dependent monooxygenase [Candidatus Freyarchaeota archaeon]
MNEITLEKTLNEYEVVIIGAGPAGCFLVKNLTEDYRVLLVDKSPIPRVKSCGGMLVEESQEIISKLNPPDYVFVNPKELGLSYIDHDNKIWKDSNRKFWNVFRGPFDYWLSRILDKKQYDFVSNTELLDFEIKTSGIKLKLKNEAIKYIKTKYLIGADGARSIIRRRIANPIKKYLAVQKYYETDDQKVDRAVFIFNNQITDFYSWIIPKQLYFVVGSALPLQNTNEKFRLFEKSLSKTIKLSKNIEIEAALLSRPQSKNDVCLGKGDIFLVGEAAGLVSPSFGEGISFALRSSQNLAKALNEDFRFPHIGYRRLCDPLVKELNDKIKKAEILSNPKMRANFINNNYVELVEKLK